MKRIIVLLLLLHTSLIFGIAPGQLVIKLASDKGEYLLGEPAALQCIIENQGDAPLVVAYDFTFPDAPCVLRVSGPVRKDCVESQGKYEIGAYVAPPPIAPHQSTSFGPIMVSAYGAVDVGEYEFWVLYDSARLGAPGLRALLPSVQAESNHLRIRLVPPTGTDLAAFKECATPCNQVTFARDMLLKDFPTSTYAGYALLPAGQCIPDPRVFLVNFLEHDKTAERWPQTTGQMTAEKKKDLEDTEKRVAQLANYLKARPDFARADALKVELAGRLAMLGRFDEAHALCDEITLKAAGGQESKKASMLMDFLTEKGYQGKKKDVSCPEPRQTAKPSNEKKP
jgi:hypothetical protein